MGIKLNPFTGKLDLISKDKENFSYNVIAVGETVEIPSGQQMLVYEDLEVDGILLIDGGVVVFDLEPLHRIVNTAASESVNIELYEVIRQTASGITTGITGAITGSEITITNRSGADNIVGLTIQGDVSPTIKDMESFSLIYNGTDYDLI